MTIYTHEFKFKLGELELEGEMEFNTDGQASWLPDVPTPLTVGQQECLTRFLSELKRMFDKFGSITKIKINEK